MSNKHFIYSPACDHSNTVSQQVWDRPTPHQIKHLLFGKKQTLEWFRKMREIFFKEMWRRENFRWWSMEAEPFHRSYQSFRTTGTQREGNKTKFFWRIKKVFSLVKRDSLVRPITSSILVHTLPFYSIENDSSTSAGASKEPPKKVFTNGNWTYFDVMSFYCPGSMGQ